MRGGTGVAGMSVGSLGNPTATFAAPANFTDGDGTGVFGSSGSGAGVRGTSKTAMGVLGESLESDAVVGKSGSGRGGVFESQGTPEGAVAQIGLVPQRMIVPGLIRSAPVQFNTSVARSLPRSGRGGDLLATQGVDLNCTLWFCSRGAEGENRAVWREVLLGTPMGTAGVTHVLWPERLVTSVGSSDEDPHHVLAGPDGRTYTLAGGLGATFGTFAGRSYPELAALLSGDRVTHGDTVSPDDLARAHVVAFERNGTGPSGGQGWESCDWTFRDAAATINVAWDGGAGAPRDPHVVANGSIRGGDYVRCFDAAAAPGYNLNS